MKSFSEIVKSKEGYNKCFDKHLELIESALNDLKKDEDLTSFKFMTYCFDNEIQIDILNECKDGLCINLEKIMHMNKHTKTAKEIRTFKVNLEEINEMVKLLSL